MTETFESPYQVPCDGTFALADLPTSPPAGIDRHNSLSKKELKAELKDRVRELADLQHRLYAGDRWSVLLIFQAMDAAGKDGTIRGLLKGVNPAGCQVASFKQPSKEELDHDYLWRTTRHLPERGRIGVFNRSYYEEVLVVRVHPEYLSSQRLPTTKIDDTFWEDRFRAIREHERHLAANGTLVLKFWLNVSREEQRQRFLSRLNEPEKHWKFSSSDVEERQHWDDYMAAYEHMLKETSRACAPWYAIPADNKPYMRLKVAEIVTAKLRALGLEFPEPSEKEEALFAEMRSLLEGQSD